MATPLMGLNEIVAGVGGDTPDVASNKIILNFQIIDMHDHTTGNGTAITTGALNIDADLSFGNNAVTDLSRSSFQSLSVAPTANQSLYVLDGDLTYRNDLGQVVPVTVGNSLGSPSEGIGGLTAPASATFSPTTDTFSFFHDGSLKGLINSSNIIMQEFTASGGTQPSESVTLAAPTLSSSHTITWPVASPAANNYYMRFTSAGAATYVPGFESDSTTPVTTNQVTYASTASSLTGLTVPANSILLGNASAPTAGQLTNDYVDAAAAIEGTKIDPDFGSQAIVTTGTASTGALTATSLDSNNTLEVTNAATFNGSVSITDSNDTFTIAPPSTFSSTIGVTGTATFDGNVELNGNITTGITASSTLTVAGTSTLNGVVEFNNAANFNANVTLGDTTADMITFTGRVATNILPTSSGGADLGSTFLEWGTVHANVHSSQTALVGLSAFERFQATNTSGSTRSALGLGENASGDEYGFITLEDASGTFGNTYLWFFNGVLRFSTNTADIGTSGGLAV